MGKFQVRIAVLKFNKRLMLKIYENLKKRDKNKKFLNRMKKKD
jgi:hypothetical protein